jgi:hypothetical protein
MLPSIITSSIKIGSFASGYGSISGKARHIIVIKRHWVVGRLIVISSSFLSLFGDFLFKWGVFFFAWERASFYPFVFAFALSS